MRRIVLCCLSYARVKRDLVVRCQQSSRSLLLYFEKINNFYSLVGLSCCVNSSWHMALRSAEERFWIVNIYNILQSSGYVKWSSNSWRVQCSFPMLYHWRLQLKSKSTNGPSSSLGLSIIQRIFFLRLIPELFFNSCFVIKLTSMLFYAHNGGWWWLCFFLFSAGFWLATIVDDLCIWHSTDTWEKEISKYGGTTDMVEVKYGRVSNDVIETRTYMVEYLFYME